MLTKLAAKVVVLLGITAMLATTGASAARATPSRFAPTYRPDGLLSLGAGPFRGNNIYNATGASQMKRVSLRRGRTAIFHWRSQNDGATSDELCLRGAGGNAAFKIRFFLGRKNITAGVVAWTFMKTEPAHQHSTVTVRITAANNAPIGAVRRELLKVTSTGSGLADTVLARVTVTK